MAAHNLPSFANPFIGRADELSQIAALLHDPTCRLLTLTGPGGIGKTRLAVEATRLILDDATTAFSDGCYFVPLQPIDSPGFIVHAIANVLHLTFRGEQDLKQQLLDHLGEKHLLLVLDNFEHLAEGADLLPEMLAYASKIKLLVTSRERLRMREEWLFDVGGLTFPDDTHPGAWDDFTAVQLFLQSARRAGLAPADADMASIVRICQMVEGSPLAVDLAAAWVRVMPCAEIAREVEHSLDILTSTARNMPEKHRSIRAAFERSWELLSAKDQAAFRKLSVFRGGFTREAAAQVAGATLPILASLVDRSLVRVNASGRYNLHELLRQYAADKLLVADEVDATNQGHVNYFLWMAEGAEAHAFGSEQVAWFDRVEVELDNLRAVLGRSVETETGLRMAGALGWFFSERGYWVEGLEWLERMLAANPDAPDSALMKALHNAGAQAGLQGDQLRARAYCEQALELARAANDRWNIAWSLCHLANFGCSKPEQCAVLLEEGLALFRELGDQMGLAHSLIRLAWAAIFRGDYPYARRLTEEAVARAREAGDLIITAWAANTLGQIAWFQDHDLEQARTYFENSLSLMREGRVQIGVDNALLALARVELLLGNTIQAQRYDEEAVILLRENRPDSGSLSGALIMLASIAQNRGQYERAATLLGAAHSGHWDVVMLFGENPALVCDEEDVRAQLGESAFAKAWAVGRAMTREKAIAYALEERTASGEPAIAPAAKQRSSSAGSSDTLNARELEVLALVADGLSNREISSQLFVSVNTVKWYLKVTFEKLDVANRTEAVAHAQALGLLSQSQE